MSVTQCPPAISARLARTSLVRNAIRGSKPCSRAVAREQPGGGRRGPDLLGELGGADALALAASAVVGRQRRDHRLLEEVVAARARVLAALDRRVLEAHGEVQLALADARGQVGGAALDDADLELGLGLAQARDRRRHDRRQRARERADAQPARLGADQLAEL